MNTTATSSDAYALLHEGALALADVEENGIRVDVERLEETIRKIDSETRKKERQLKSHRYWKRWVRLYGDKAKLGSKAQLTKVLSVDHKFTEQTAKKQQYKATDTILSALKDPFVDDYMMLTKLKHLRNNYLIGISREVEGDRIHPVQNLHVAKSHRSSVAHPSFQNYPIRTDFGARIVRQCIIPSDDHALVEIDYGGHEFRIAACFWNDEDMIDYASDPEKDIHRDLASMMFLLRKSQVSKGARHVGKNMFVFPQLYGDYWANCARNAWEAADNIATERGIPIKRWLRRRRGISKLGSCDPDDPPDAGTFAYHIKQVERRFHKMFPAYSDNKGPWWDDYINRGYFDILTGFRLTGVFTRNMVYNYPVQGPAFHCLLWSLIRLNQWLNRQGFCTKIICQIHDSILLDVYLPELKAVLKQAKNIMTKAIQDAWDWIVVPLEAEAKVGEKNWYDMRPLAI